MNFNSSDYFTYKKNRIQREIESQKKPISKFHFLVQLFIATFIIIFILIVIFIMKYSSKMDIEYAKGDLQISNSEIMNVDTYNNLEEEEQGRIDKRLILIQQEENAPSEAKIIAKDVNNQEVIDPSHIQNNKIIEKQAKMEKIQELQMQEEKESSAIVSLIKNKSDCQKNSNNSLINENITIMSKVLIGKYQTFEEAQKLQTAIKAKNPKLKPFVRKVGSVFSVQMGSYKDFNVAKNHAQELSIKGFDVWIFQQ